MDEKMMERALQLAERGWGKTRPNPLVGAVVVRDQQVISEGHHDRFGGDHAELAALKKIDFQGEGATLYVNLEPCSHHGKTPPCVEAIIKSKIKRVVVAMTDPNPLVAGNGIKLLKNHGIEVTLGVLRHQAATLNEIFIKYITQRKPFCILKTAMTLDGKIATVTGDAKWISGQKSRAYVHHIRNRVSGIMVGVNTVIADNPMLNTRKSGQEVTHPTRIIVDSHCRIPLTSHVVTTAKEQPTIIASTRDVDSHRIAQLKEHQVEVIQLPSRNGRVDLVSLMAELGKREIDSVLLEGGSTLNGSALEASIVDKIMVFVAPKILGGERAPTPVGGNGIKQVIDAIQLENITVKSYAEDILIEAYVEGRDNNVHRDY
ncbi:bifunctional diaminohydroxyphosphoribosylaminopyrimidine deaminase/5-amino-6-(5-phosphoribosylamino)uracil reductase RibD [Alkaliphilus crotonatoxidans]|jgi:diaminohydroxyphosphoribosylaminopyrimidine deaminase/5-amino-6-(5-phosphoribosylamino)uracil reductase